MATCLQSPLGTVLFVSLLIPALPTADTYGLYTGNF